MNVLVDTSVWSLALRRAKVLDVHIAQELAELVREGRVEMIGPIRQELLSGMKESAQFRALRAQLSAFVDIQLEREDFEQAAHCYNQCRAKGIQASNTDLLMCAVATRHRLSVFTTDQDFVRMRDAIPLVLHVPRA